MYGGAFAPVLLCLITGFSILLMLLRPRGISEVYWIGAGALSLLALRLIPLSLAGKAVAKGLDVYLFLIGMMLLSELAREQGIFEWLASIALKSARGSRTRLFSLVYGIGTLVTIFMSNDATAVVLTPAILAAVRKAKAPPLAYLFACAFIANAASFVLPISNPANLVVFHQGMPPLGRWLLAFGLPSLLSILLTYLLMRLLFHRELTGQVDSTFEPIAMPAHSKIVLAGLGLVIAILLTASSLNQDLGLPTCLSAIGVTAVVTIKTRSNPWSLIKEISWSTLTLVAGLFILVDAVESVGALSLTQSALTWTQSLSPLSGALVSSLSVGVANNLVNNLPMGLIAGSTLQASHASGLIANAVMIGIDLGPNLSITGSLATILWLIALRKEKLDVRFMDFLKIGAIVMPITLLISIFGAVLAQKIFQI
jgi:arsenical pump membrane protein